MTVQQTIHYELANSTDIDQLVHDLERIDARTIIVAFLSSSSWQVTDLQLARLVAAARTWNKRLIAERGSDSVAERAMLLGFQDLAVVSDSPGPNQIDTSSFIASSEAPTTVLASVGASNEITAGFSQPEGNEDPTSVLETPEKFYSTADLATYKPVADVPGTSIVAGNLSPNPSQAAPASNSRNEAGGLREPANGNDAPRRPPSSTGVSSESDSPSRNPANKSRAIGREPAEHAVPVEAPANLKPSRRRFGVWKIAAAVLAPLLVVGVVAAIAVYMLPTANVILIPQEESITSRLTYGVDAADSTYDISMDPTPLRSVSTAEGAREATGERYEPAGTAGGLIQITNPLTQEVTVPAGTEIPGPNGVMYYTAEDVRIPAADPYGSVSFGLGSVGVYAGVIGPDGNIEAGSLTGQMGTQMFYTNPEPISGGRLDQFPVITEGDIAAVRDQVSSELVNKAEDEFKQEIPEGFELVPGTLEVGEPEVEVSASAGQDGEQVSASGSIEVSAQIYDPEELHQLAGDEADRQLARQGGSERILLAETVTLKEPTSLGNGQPAYQINVEAVARTVITDVERESLVNDLAGLSQEEAEALLGNHPKVDRFQVTIEPDWFLDRMPEIASRISVHVSSGEQTASR